MANNIQGVTMSVNKRTMRQQLEAARKGPVIEQKQVIAGASVAYPKKQKAVEGSPTPLPTTAAPLVVATQPNRVAAPEVNPVVTSPTKESALVVSPEAVEEKPEPEAALTAAKRATKEEVVVVLAPAKVAETAKNTRTTEKTDKSEK